MRNTKEDWTNGSLFHVIDWWVAAKLFTIIAIIVTALVWLAPHFKNLPWLIQWGIARWG